MITTIGRSQSATTSPALAYLNKLAYDVFLARASSFAAVHQLNWVHVAKYHKREAVLYAAAHKRTSEWAYAAMLIEFHLPPQLPHGIATPDWDPEGSPIFHPNLHDRQGGEGAGGKGAKGKRRGGGKDRWGWN